MESHPNSTSGTGNTSSPGEPNASKRLGWLWIPISMFILLTMLVALPNFIATGEKQKAAATKGTMRTVHIAVESYATDSGGTYPDHFQDVLPYLPGGATTIGGKAGKLPELSDVLDVGPLTSQQFDDWYGSKNRNPEQVIFCGIRENGQKECTGYAIMGPLIRGVSGKPLVL